MFSFFEVTLFFNLPISFIFLILMVYFYLSKNSMEWVKCGIKGMMLHLTSRTYSSAMVILVMLIVVLLFNLLSLVPYSFPCSSLPMFTLSMSVMLWAGGYFYCLWENFHKCVAHFLPLSSPVVLAVILVWIEIISWLCRPLALGVRLMANITASHVLLFLISCSVFFSSMFLSVVLVFLLLLMLLEVSVAVIQSYVYSLLLSLYMTEGLE